MPVIIANRWLSNFGWPEINDQNGPAYEYADYPNKKSGPGRAANLYDQGHWFAKIWTDDKESCDVIADRDESENLTLAVAATLRVRQNYHDGKSATEAFDDVVKLYGAIVVAVPDLELVLDSEW